MSFRESRLLCALVLCLATHVCAQIPTVATAVDAVPDAFSTETGDFVLDIPGVGDDFVRFADGAWDVRANGTARVSMYVHRRSTIDRAFFVVLELSGRVGPGDPAHPPSGSPVLTMLPGAYVPAGPVDPTQFVYYTQATGTLTGLRAYDGARLTASLTAPLQVGVGASNKNVQLGMAASLALTVVQQPLFGTISVLAPAQLRSELRASHPTCASHVDPQPLYSGSTTRLCVSIPGLGNDYIMVPAGSWTDAANGSATLTTTLRRQSDYADAWQLQLTLGGRIVPGTPAHPPAGGPVLQLLASAYSAQGGPVDPAQWRYFATATGTLQGLEDNAGGAIALATSGPFQVGLGAGQGNTFIGCSGSVAATVTQQPTAGPITVTGPIELHTNLSADCLLPTPQVLNGVVQSIASVTEQRLVYTGIDLGFCTQAAVGPIILGTDRRRWYEGHMRVVAHDRVEVALPQGLPAASYPVRLGTITGLSNQLTANVQPPATPTLRTDDDRLPGEPQRWVSHLGNLPNFVITLFVFSTSNVPSFAPGLIDLQIGNQFTDYVVFDAQLNDPVTGVAVAFLPSVPATLGGLRLYAEGALLTSAGFPLLSTDVWFTDY